MYVLIAHESCKYFSATTVTGASSDSTGSTGSSAAPGSTVTDGSNTGSTAPGIKIYSFGKSMKKTVFVNSGGFI